MKVHTQVHDAVTLTAGAGNTTSSAVDLSYGNGATVSIKLTNGATGPTVAAQVQIQVSHDNSKWFNAFNVFKGGTGNAGVFQWGDIPISAGVKYLRTVSGSNTAQDVTVDVDVTNIVS